MMYHFLTVDCHSDAIVKGLRDFVDKLRKPVVHKTAKDTTNSDPRNVRFEVLSEAELTMEYEGSPTKRLNS